MSWNFRVMESTDKAGATYRAIHEVFYKDDGTPYGYGADPAIIMSTDINPKDKKNRGLMKTLSLMMEALRKPVLIASEMVRGQSKEQPQ